MTAYPMAGESYDAMLRAMQADDIVLKSGDVAHATHLRQTVTRLLDGDLQSLLSKRAGTMLTAVSAASSSWQERHARALNWRRIVRRHLGAQAVSPLADPLVRAAAHTSESLTRLENELLTGFRARSTIDQLDLVQDRLEETISRGDRDWLEGLHAASYRTALPWRARSLSA
jgi:hypothetical protein